MRIAYFLGLPLSKANRRIITDSCVKFDSDRLTKYGKSVPSYYSLTIPAGIRPALDKKTDIVLMEEDVVCEDFRKFLIRKDAYPFYLEMDETYELPYDFHSYCFSTISVERNQEYFSSYSKRVFSNISVFSETGSLYTAEIVLVDLLESDLSYRLFRRIGNQITLTIKGLTNTAMHALCATKDINKESTVVGAVTYTGKRSLIYTYSHIKTIEENIENIRRRITGVFTDLSKFGASWGIDDVTADG